MSSPYSFRCTAALNWRALGVFVLGVVIAGSRVAAQEPLSALAIGASAQSPSVPSDGERSAVASYDGVPRFPMGESEPNDFVEDADNLVHAGYGVGDISPVGDVDWWSSSFAGLEDDILFVYCDTSMSSGGTDSELALYADDGTTLIELDDDDGPGFSSCIAGAVVSQPGGVYYRVNEHSGYAEISPYALYQLRSSFSYQVEHEANNDPSTANKLDEMVYLNGALPGGDPGDWYWFWAYAGEPIVAIVDEDPDDDGNALETVLHIFHPDGLTILAEGDNGSGASNCAGAVVAPIGGRYFLRVTNGGGGGGDVDYRFVVLINGDLVPVELQQFSVE